MKEENDYIGTDLNEKEAIAKATADAFVDLYNREMGTFFSIVEYCYPVWSLPLIQSVMHNWDKRRA